MVKMFDYLYHSRFRKTQKIKLGKESAEISSYSALTSLGRVNNVAIELGFLEEEKESKFEYVMCKSILYQFDKKRDDIDVYLIAKGKENRKTMHFQKGKSQFEKDNSKMEIKIEEIKLDSKDEDQNEVHIDNEESSKKKVDSNSERNEPKNDEKSELNPEKEKNEIIIGSDLHSKNEHSSDNEKKEKTEGKKEERKEDSFEIEEDLQLSEKKEKAISSLLEKEEKRSFK